MATLSDALSAYRLFALAEGLSAKTIRLYRIIQVDLGRFSRRFLGDRPYFRLQRSATKAICQLLVQDLDKHYTSKYEKERPTSLQSELRAENEGRSRPCPCFLHDRRPSKGRREDY